MDHEDDGDETASGVTGADHVRILGAQTAGSIVGEPTQAVAPVGALGSTGEAGRDGEASPSHQADVAGGDLARDGAWHHDGEGAGPAPAESELLDEGWAGYEEGEPEQRPGDSEAIVATAPPELPHWSDPPTGQVPAVLDRRGDDAEDGRWPVDTGPVWREHAHEWEQDADFEPALLADEGARLGALDESAPIEERQPWEFDDASLLAEGAEPAGPAANGDDGAEPSGSQSIPQGAHAPRVRILGGAVSAESADEVASPYGGTAGADRGSSGAGEGWRDDAPGREGSPSAHRPAPRPGSPRARRPVGRQGGPRQPAGTDGGSRSGRNLPVAIAVGVGLALATIVCLFAGTVPTVVLVTVLLTAAAGEYCSTVRRAGWRPATLLVLVATPALMIAAYIHGPEALGLVLALFVASTMVWYLVGAERGPAIEGMAVTLLGFCWVALLGSFAALLLAPGEFPDRHGIAFFFGAIVAVVGADIGALTVGAWLGKHPLAPAVSPGKTWEGYVGGILLAVLLSVAITGQIHPWTVPDAALLGLVAGMIGPLGDLSESMVKRELGIKDMGRLLPEHGGLLDRFDAMLFVLPATYYLVRTLHLG